MKTKYNPIFEAGFIGNGRISFALGMSAERRGVYGGGYGLPATAVDIEASAYVNFFLWSVEIGFIKRKGVI